MQKSSEKILDEKLEKIATEWVCPSSLAATTPYEVNQIRYLKAFGYFLYDSLVDLAEKDE